MKYITPYITAHSSPFLSSKNTGLGNVLFQIASCYGIAKDNNCGVIYNNVKYYCDLLYHKYKYNHKDTILRNIYSINDSILFDIMINENSNDARKYSNELISSITTNNCNIMINGYLESMLYFNKYKSEIIELFSIDDASFSIIMEKYGHILQSFTPVSIHFRGNEYFSINGTDYDYNYYNRAIDYIYKHIINPYFLLFTDDYNSIDFMKLHMKDYIHITHQYDYLELWTISLCKHNIISNSTFSWWGAFLNKNENKIILCNKNTYNKFSETHTDFLQI
jgi:hypothetical protein